MSNESLCAICYTKNVSYAFIPCGHLSLCYECATTYAKSYDKCMLCNQRFTTFIKIYFPTMKDATITSKYEQELMMITNDYNNLKSLLEKNMSNDQYNEIVLHAVKTNLNSLKYINKLPDCVVNYLKQNNDFFGIEKNDKIINHLLTANPKCIINFNQNFQDYALTCLKNMYGSLKSIINILPNVVANSETIELSAEDLIHLIDNIHDNNEKKSVLNKHIDKANDNYYHKIILYAIVLSLESKIDYLNDTDEQILSHENILKILSDTIDNINDIPKMYVKLSLLKFEFTTEELILIANYCKSLSSTQTKNIYIDIINVICNICKNNDINDIDVIVNMFYKLFKIYIDQDTHNMINFKILNAINNCTTCFSCKCNDNCACSTVHFEWTSKLITLLINKNMNYVEYIDIIYFMNCLEHVVNFYKRDAKKCIRKILSNYDKFDNNSLMTIIKTLSSEKMTSDILNLCFYHNYFLNSSLFDVKLFKNEIKELISTGLKQLGDSFVLYDNYLQYVPSKFQTKNMCLSYIKKRKNINDITHIKSFVTRINARIMLKNLTHEFIV